MPIPEQQLELWSHQGAVATSRDTRISIYNALKAPSSPIAHLNFEVYLQGSYGNVTNIRASSDVDIVIQLNSTYFYNLDALPQWGKEACTRECDGRATYRWEDFRKDVTLALQEHYGTSQVRPSNKCIKVRETHGRMAADVVPALLYKKFTRYRSKTDHAFVPGIGFIAQDSGRLVVNYPGLHRENGENKNTNFTNGWFKPMVRVFKNARRRAVETGVLAEDVAPSYFLECLLYNVPNHLFGGSLGMSFENALVWISKQSPDVFWCQNGHVRLFGDTLEQWNVDDAVRFVSAMATLWDGWQ